MLLLYLLCAGYSKYQMPNFLGKIKFCVYKANSMGMNAWL